ncbi:MAG: hypothetical protein ACI9FJ_002074 [Alteromonadaceae bacterium]|jgi:hypothetical protein
MKSIYLLYGLFKLSRINIMRSSLSFYGDF